MTALNAKTDTQTGPAGPLPLSFDVAASGSYRKVRASRRRLSARSLNQPADNGLKLFRVY